MEKTDFDNYLDILPVEMHGEILKQVSHKLKQVKEGNQKLMEKNRSLVAEVQRQKQELHKQTTIYKMETAELNRKIHRLENKLTNSSVGRLYSEIEELRDINAKREKEMYEARRERDELIEVCLQRGFIVIKKGQNNNYLQKMF